MKIGTLTFHRACNYGGVLQCYALVTYLRSLGYSAEVIDYRSRAIEKSYAIINTKSFKHFFSSILNFFHTIKTKKNFRKFLNANIPISNQVYYGPNELSNQYDLFFIGSDQIWSKRINKGFDPVYWGQFEGKIVSYAASMGTDHDYSEYEYKKISSFLQRFHCISTREDSLRNEIAPYTKKRVQTVIDPVLLLSVHDYKKIAVKPKEEQYVLYYQMEYNSASKDFVANIARQLNCSVITIMGPNEYYGGIEHIHKSTFQVSVEELVGYIYNARCVISSSFHGTALPIAMQKDFYFLANRMTDRSENLLRHIGAIDRMKKSTEMIEFTPVDYSVITPYLNSFITESKNYIKECIER